MSTRERWIVYPLLFLTLGIALRDKVILPSRLGAMEFEAGQIVTQRIRCNQLQVKEVLCDRLDSNQTECRTFLVKGPASRPVVIAGADAKTGAGAIETLTSNGIPQVRLYSNNIGGQITTFEVKKTPPTPTKKPDPSNPTPDKSSSPKPQEKGASGK
jgi:hypothetical protein